MIELETRKTIKNLISLKIQKKLESYAAETEHKPFFEAIFKKEVVLKASIMQSIYTSFGMSIYEQMGIILANNAGYSAARQYVMRGSIDDETKLLIGAICDSEIGTYTKNQEVDMIRASILPGEAAVSPDSTVDVRFIDNQGAEICIDITTVKPNKKETRAMRKKLLEWTAMRLSQDPNANIETYIGIPYNPYFPNEYSRPFVLANAHYPDEVLVQENLWRKFAGNDVYDDLMEIFLEVGTELESEIENLLN